MKGLFVFLFLSSSLFASHCMSKVFFNLVKIQGTIKEWKYDANLLSKINSLFTSESSDPYRMEELRDYFLLRVQDRISRIPQNKQEVVHNIIKTLVETDYQEGNARFRNGGITPFFYTKENRIVPGSMYQSLLSKLSIDELILFFHELEHVIQKNTTIRNLAIYIDRFRITPDIFYPFVKYQGEVEASAAEWEFLQLIPKDLRKRWYKRLSSRQLEMSEKHSVLIHPRRKANLNITTSIRLSFLSKDEFIQQMLPRRGANFRNIWKRNFYISKQSLPGIYMLIMIISAGYIVFSDSKIPFPYDLYFLFRD